MYIFFLKLFYILIYDDIIFCFFLFSDCIIFNKEYKILEENKFKII